MSVATTLLAQKTISFKALQRCRTTIKDFCCTYFPLYGLDPGKDLFKHLDVLLFVEATIYQMDEENEALCSLQALSSSGHSTAAAPGGSSSGSGRSAAQHTFQGASVLLDVLDQQRLLSERVAAELHAGQLYWQEERRVCAELAQLRPGHPVNLRLADIVATHELKSFDYRVLHLLLIELLGRPYDEVLLEFMRVDEMLIDIGDDLTDYEDDVVAHSFNIFRGYVYLYGQEAPLRLTERISELEAQRSRLLAQLPPEVQAHVLKRQQDAVEEEGADKWAFPVVIRDEARFRADAAEG